MGQSKKSKQQAGCMIVGVAIMLWIGGCMNGSRDRDQADSESGSALSESEPHHLAQSGASTESGTAPVELHSRDGALIRNVITWHPDQVKLVKNVSLSVETPEKRIVAEPAAVGTEVKLMGIDRGQLFIEFKGVVQKIPAAATDLAEQMAAVYTTP